MSVNLPRRTFLQHLALSGPLVSAFCASSAVAQQAGSEKPHKHPKKSRKQGKHKDAPMLPPLPYPYNALEPAIDERTMHIHHDKHHAGYVAKFNKALIGHADLAAKRIEELLSDIPHLSPKMQTAVRHNGAGVYNHTLFWQCMAPAGAGGGGKPQGKLAEAIERDLGGWPAFQEAFSKASATQFASGWAWLVVGQDGKLFVCSTPNHDNPLMIGLVERTGTPILTLDVWEHAYYLNYQNRRTDYITAFWNVVNWPGVAQRFVEATQ